LLPTTTPVSCPLPFSAHFAQLIFFVRSVVTGVPQNISSNPELLAEILSYHVVPGSYNFSYFSECGNTILRTYLNSSSQDFLEPGENQVLVATQNGTNVKILNQK
jgi:uncharacterized surface protein with fasciclin (FAS1) repeats